VLRIKAHAKINLSLKILGKRPDGFHEIESLMQSVSLYDLLTLTPIPSGIQLATTNLRLPADGRNLAYQAAEVFFRANGLRIGDWGIKIYVEKNIPLAAGLAGGSADAAAVLYGLNRMVSEELRMPAAQLMKLGEEIGSDVPFCLVGGSCTVKGRGERVSRNPLPITRYYVLVVPEIEVSTKWAYEAFDQMTNSELRMPNEGIRNYLEPAVIKKYPIIQKIKEKLLALGCSYAQMSGSGPGVFGVTNDASAAEKIAVEMKNDHPRSFFVHSVGAGVEAE
jgi:4-diphosphocytidyl-2-C-methyl-D-erythritol kinase